VRLGVTPEVNAISTLLLAFVGIILAISALALNRPARDLA
jgi:ABC-type spermidine/putrescine transport system permease subunit II